MKSVHKTGGSRWRAILALVAITTLLMLPMAIHHHTGGTVKATPKGSAHMANYNPHPPIRINGNDDFTAANGVTSGNGTENNPYIIEGWDIDISDAANSGITIKHTNKYFIIQGCYVHDGEENEHTCYGIALWNVSHGCIKDCEIVRNDDGITIRSDGGTPSTRNTVTNCTLSDNDYGFFMYYSHHNNITGCTIRENQNGIVMLYSDYNNISRCLVLNNTENGIRMSNPSREVETATAYAETRTRFNVVYDCTVSGNARGIEVRSGAAENMIVTCDIAGNEYYGVVLVDRVHNNTITGCTIQENMIGIDVLRSYYFGPSDDNLIYHNAFIGNDMQAIDTCDNRWDNGSVGNYWSTYPWFDLNGDGIGDLPKYVPGGLNWDRYPLMQRK